MKKLFLFCVTFVFAAFVGIGADNSQYIYSSTNIKIELNIFQNDELEKLQITFEKLAKKHLLPKYLKKDPNLKAGYTGSFKTGYVGNTSKPTNGDPINLDDFDIDYWIESDILNEEYGNNLRADVDFRKILSETPGFEGLRPNKKGFSIRFLPSN